jgi:nucleotide-binding universal stress UspA family protein
VVRRLPAKLTAVAERLRRKAASLGLNNVDTEVTTGLAARAIIETALRQDADLIVMGVASRAWIDRLVFGSTLGRVLRQAATPVLVIPVVAGAEAWENARGFQWEDGVAWTTAVADRAAA